MKQKSLLFFTTLILACITTHSQSYRNMSREDRLNKEYCSPLFDTQNGVYFDMLRDPQAVSAFSYQNILEWLEGRVAGLQVYRTGNNERIPYIRNSVAGIYVDEVWRDPGFLDNFPISDIGMIKVIKGPFLGGYNSPGGAIAIYTVIDTSLE